MARKSSLRRKQSVHDKQAAKQAKPGAPKSMVIRIGASEVGSSVTQLVQDMRHVMEPDTALRLKVSFIFSISALSYNLMDLGTKSQQTPRLHYHGWTSRRHTSAPLFPL